MQTVIQAGDAEKKSRGGGEKETRQINELEHPPFTDEG